MSKRWLVKVTYRSAVRDVVIDYDAEVISEVADLIEFGPHFDTVIRIEIEPNPAHARRLTVEEAEAL